MEYKLLTLSMNSKPPASYCEHMSWLPLVTDRASGKILRLQRVCEYIASGLGSIKLLKHGLQIAMLLGNK